MAATLLTPLPQTVCTICRQRITTERIPILGEDVQIKTQRLMTALMKHLQEKHQDRLIEIIRATQHYQTLLTLQAFELVDQPLIDAKEVARKFAEKVLTTSPLPVSTKP